MSIDYEVEYNNRARVPEHPEIFARWQRDAEAYRIEATTERRAELGFKYGPSPRQFIDLFTPKSGGANVPLAMFIHGGYWRSLEPAMFSQMARGMNARSITVAVAGYDLVPQVAIRDIIAQIQAACVQLWKRFGRRIMVCGHSAGGHLAACMLATDWKALNAPADLVPSVMTISGVHDLSPLIHIANNVEFKLDAAEAKRVSPIHWTAPKGGALDAVVGGNESAEFLRQSKIIVEAWGKDNATRYEAAPGMNHFTVCDPMSDPGSAMTARLVALTERTR
jgi:arylformamidase